MVFVFVNKVEVVDIVGVGDMFNVGVLVLLYQVGKLIKVDVVIFDVDMIIVVLILGNKVVVVIVSCVGVNLFWVNEL